MNSFDSFFLSNKLVDVKKANKLTDDLIDEQLIKFKYQITASYLFDLLSEKKLGKQFGMISIINDGILIKASCNFGAILIQQLLFGKECKSISVNTIVPRVMLNHKEVNALYQEIPFEKKIQYYDNLNEKFVKFKYQITVSYLLGLLTENKLGKRFDTISIINDGILIKASCSVGAILIQQLLFGEECKNISVNTLSRAMRVPKVILNHKKVNDLYQQISLKKKIQYYDNLDVDTRKLNTIDYFVRPRLGG